MTVTRSCEGCQGATGLPPITANGFCTECADAACSDGDGPRVGLPVPADIEAALTITRAHRCTDDNLETPERCPVCAFGTAHCPECDQSMEDLGASAYDDHRIANENWVAVACEGYVMPLVRAAAAHAGLPARALTEPAPTRKAPAMTDDPIRSDYINQFYAPGDQLLDGAVVGPHHVGVRVCDDVDITGTPWDIANLGQALVSRFRHTQYALVTGSLSDGHTFHGPCAPGEPAAEDLVSQSQAEGVNYDYVTLHPLAATPVQPAGPSGFDRLTPDEIEIALTTLGDVYGLLNEDARDALTGCQHHVARLVMDSLDGGGDD